MPDDGSGGVLPVNVLLILSHSIEEHDQIKLLSGLGYNVFSLGGYIDPRSPHDPKRPAIPSADFPERAALQAAVDGPGLQDNIGNAASHIPDAILEWADVIVCHHYLERIFGQWDHLAEWRAGGGRVVWRTVGQSVENNERIAAPYVRDGLQVVRYSTKERNIPGYAGEDAFIRFYKDPAEWCGWTGERLIATNVTQELLQRKPWTNPDFWIASTDGIPTMPGGPGSEALPGGVGELPFEDMKALLRECRCYLYTGTQPASYTLGLLEALITGIPVVSIGASHMQVFPYGPLLFEGHELANFAYEAPSDARECLEVFLRDDALAERVSTHQRFRAIREFGIDKVGADWRAFLGTP